ncbi:MAG: homoserine kinase [Candidatus Methanomethylicaceae archaeon]|jgi:homoserine kinase
MGSLEIKVSAPATIANLGPGYDLVGLALEKPRDTLTVSMSKSGKDKLKISGVGSETISPASGKNACMVAGRAVLEATGKGTRSLEMTLSKGVPPRMGMGSSGASSAAGAFAVNLLLGKPLSIEELLRCAMEGERAACGAPHADNVAPALLGGVTVILGFDPLRVIRLDPLKESEIVIISPELDLGDEKTKLARDVLPPAVPLSTMVRQMGAYSSLILGLMIKDPRMTGRGISGDVIVEPARAKLIPGFSELKVAALEAGAYGFSISGAGPSVFALCPVEKGEDVGRVVKGRFAKEGVASKYGVYRCGEEGAKVVP